VKWGMRARLNVCHRREGNIKLILHTSDPMIPFMQSVLLVFFFLLFFFFFFSFLFLVLKMTKHLDKAARQKYGKGQTVRHIVLHLCVRYETDSYPCHKPAQMTNRGG